MALPILIALGLSLFGTSVHILLLFAMESDKYENKKANFNAARFAAKNVWDFRFYVVAGFAVLTIKSVITYHIGVDGVTEHGLSCMSGFLGSKILKKLI
jgi:phosphoglycerol transferase MdoB-like AlkP superfamily enzyme